MKGAAAKATFSVSSLTAGHFHLYQEGVIGVFVYRLGHSPLKAERRVRFPYALPMFVTRT